jgi:TldD protein
MGRRNSSRRTFLKCASAAAALGLVAQLPGSSRLWAAAPEELLSEPEEALLRELALAAVEAARSAGATFADVRVTSGRLLSMGAGFNRPQGQRPGVGWPSLTLRSEYGVRAVVDGAWGFAGGSVLTAEAVASVARLAVSRARSNKPRKPRTLELAPAPQVESGRWASPVERDPFTVPVREQAELALAALAAAEAVPGVVQADTQFTWAQNLRVFASSEGSLTVQRVSLAWPGASAIGRAGEQYRLTREGVDTLLSGAYGYEAVGSSNLVEELRRAAERAVEASRREAEPQTSTEVGRYDLVLSARAVASLLSGTLAQAVDLERALGYQANWAGTSFAAPPAEILGKYQVASPLLTLRADRTRPHSSVTVGWDDEGVPAGEHTLIREGVIVDYLTTRQTAAEVGELYRAHGAPLGSRGCASGAGQSLPGVRLPNLTMMPGRDSSVSVDELVADTKRGFYVQDAGASTDQQVLSLQSSGGGVREIRNGKLGGRIKDFAFQATTPGFWKSIDAIGGSGSAVDAPMGTGYSTLDPLQLPMAVVSAVPARFREVNVLNTGRTA